MAQDTGVYWSRGSFSRGWYVACLNNIQYLVGYNIVYCDDIAPGAWNRDVKVVCFMHLNGL